MMEVYKYIDIMNKSKARATSSFPPPHEWDSNHNFTDDRYR
jgi:hypothetical protein